MSQANIDNLQLDLEELRNLAAQAKRSKVQQLLSIDIRKLETDLLACKQKQEASATTTKPPAPVAGDCKRYRVELKEYAWDQSDKFIKIFVTVKDVQHVPEESVNAEFTANSFNLLINNLNNKDFTFVVNHLLFPIDPEKSYRKLKSDMVAIYLAKASQGQKWAHLTVTAKRLQEIKDERIALKDDSADPQAGLMKVMQQLYDSGDSETKRMINKAWHQSQNKTNLLDGGAMSE
ncbi:calcyclin-binding protein [Culex pipiens pallens]|uniref:calcyclin-binding protein n=1 Tax=Culex pipiens pallens TaxID=42434 RepID=UPI001952C3B2|nr:calcyclin-binding protein [Culex pipiens pallens]